MSKGNIFLTSDTHFGHRNIITYCNRPFDSVELMNEVLIEAWNNIVTSHDTVLHLGDFGLIGKDRLMAIGNRLKGKKVLLRGNHDGLTHSAYSDMGFTCPGFKDISPRLMVEHDGTIFTCCHYPFLEDDDQRYVEKRPKQEELSTEWLLCGHVHEKWKVKGKAINVGVDVWGFAPVPIEEITALIKEMQC